MHRLDSQTVGDFFDRLAQAGQGCLMLDYDGTLAPFTEDRSEAVPYPGVVELIERIAGHGNTLLAVVSGRAVREVRDLLGIRHGLQYWGSHGAEQLDADGGYSSYQLSPEQSSAVRDAQAVLESLVPQENIELKPFSVALHWRGVGEPLAIGWRDEVAARWQQIAAASSLAVHGFNGGIEIRPRDATKANAVRSILARADANSPAAYLGDDLTDEDAFSALPPDGLAVLVGDVPRESAAPVFARRFAEVLEFLVRWDSSCG